MKVEAVGEVHQEIEERFSHGYCFDDQRDSIRSSLEAVNTDDEATIE